MTRSTDAGAAVYSPLTLKLYDAWVLGISNRFAWQCPTRQVLQPFFDRHVGAHHLDVGVGTGYYLAKANLPPTTHVSLLDLNPSSLAAAKQRLGRDDTPTLQHDVFKPLDASRTSVTTRFRCFTCCTVCRAAWPTKLRSSPTSSHA